MGMLVPDVFLVNHPPAGSVTLLLSVLILCVAACTACRSRAALEQVRAAHTPAEEAAAFEAVQASAERVGFTALDEQGRVIDISQDQWWLRAKGLTLLVDGTVVDHRLIEPTNVLILMRE